MQIDVYDFDKTVVPYDSAMRYWGWCLLHRPHILILLPIQLIIGSLAYIGIIPVPTFKKICFSFVSLLNTKKTVQKFWDKHEKDVYAFFRKENRDKERKCVIVSASPDFLIGEIARRLEVDYCIATHHDEKNGKLIGKVCRREQKVVRLNELLPDAEVENVYSDSLEHDRFIFELGKHCYLANKGTLKEITLDKQ